MGRFPCCDKVGVKKGPWTPEEDILLVSHVQQHDPGNWTSVPIHTGLKRGSKSCRLRWTNYLRPGIKRGTFTNHEEKMIIQLQAVLGNKWAAIASYLPERTHNDIKNHWNTHLKKRLHLAETGSGIRAGSRRWERRLQADINTARQALHDALSFDDDKPDNDHLTQVPIRTVQTTPYRAPPSYALSTENIARLLKNWTKDKKPQKKSSSGEDNYNSSCSSAVETPPAMDVDDVDEKSVFGFMDSLEYCLSSSRPGSAATSGSDPVGVFTGVSAAFDLEDWFSPGPGPGLLYP